MLILQPDPDDDRDLTWTLYFMAIRIHLLVDLKNVKIANPSEGSSQQLPSKWLPNPLSFQRLSNEKPFFERGWF
jgi:hypothetical protein